MSRCKGSLDWPQITSTLEGSSTARVACLLKTSHFKSTLATDPPASIREAGPRLASTAKRRRPSRHCPLNHPPHPHELPPPSLTWATRRWCDGGCHGDSQAAADRAAREFSKPARDARSLSGKPTSGLVDADRHVTDVAKATGGALWFAGGRRWGSGPGEGARGPRPAVVPEGAVPTAQVTPSPPDSISSSAAESHWNGGVVRADGKACSEGLSASASDVHSFCVPLQGFTAESAYGGFLDAAGRIALRCGVSVWDVHRKRPQNPANDALVCLAKDVLVTSNQTGGEATAIPFV
ncbi:hypothetical protein AAFF_G00243970 [Aldrovandia affinis]|uniref:Uncharacterized protein n=1 Tax=Aldrovandia affinis TaxID=143900 RepID=A0AAD7W307_9TELE|nr:hypothetical protein AAFF_G00243970 [Aldrovandia affinis]